MKKKYIIILSGLCFLIDLISKIIVENTISLNSSVNVITNFFNLTFIKNFGAAFGIFNNMTIFIIIVSILIFILLTLELKNFINNKLMCISYSILVGGLFGNLLDRILFGYVRDFLDFNILGYNFPVFNFGDSFIVIGTILLVVGSFVNGGKNEKNNSR